MSSNIFLCSDNHFWHKRMTELRGFKSPEEMNEALIENYNSIVSSSSTVYFLGDLSFGKLDETIAIVKRLNGTKHLIYGNHDKWIIKKKSYFESLFQIMSPYRELDVQVGNNKVKICMNHYAQRVWNKSHYGAIHLFGHSHGSLPPFGRSVDVGVDSTWIQKTEPDDEPLKHKALYPFSLERVLRFMETRQTEFVDHHRTEY